ncbi:MAG: hypothetical protein ACE5D4_07390 [Thermodesulfobacteriota bacterium]
MLQNKKFIVVLAISLACVAFYNISYFVKKSDTAAVYAEAEGEPADMMESGEENGDGMMAQESMEGQIDDSSSDNAKQLAGQLNALDNITVPSGASLVREAPLLQGRKGRNPFLTGREHRQALMGGRHGRSGKGATKHITGKMIKMIYTVNGVGHVMVGGRHYKAGDSVGGEVIIAIKDESVTLSSGKRGRELFIGSRESRSRERGG